MKKIGNILVISFVIAMFLWTYERNDVYPTVDPTLTSIVEEWKQDMNTIGVDGDKEIRRVDNIKIVKKIPYGLLNHRSTKGVMGKADYGTRSIYILERQYTRAQLKALVYHELGHYIFQLEHDHESTLMSTYLHEEDGYYENNLDSLIQIYLKKCKAAH